MAYLDRTLSAIADPTRRQILSHLSNGEMTVMQIAKQFPLTQPTISAHLKVLEQAGLIVRSRRAQARPCRLKPNALRELENWVASIQARFEQNYTRLDAVLEDLKESDDVG